MPKSVTGSSPTGVIEIKINSPEQILNSFDPSPFRERDLDDRAADYIIATAEETGGRGPLTLVIELPEQEMGRELVLVLPAALQNSFSYRALSARRQLRDLFRTGRLALAIGFGVLAVCVVTMRALELVIQRAAFFMMIEQGLFVLGWVAVWRPLETFLYDWWPLKSRINLLDRLAAAEVKVRPR